jgi:hypothetical protein
MEVFSCGKVYARELSRGQTSDMTLFRMATFQAESLVTAEPHDRQ